MQEEKPHEERAIPDMNNGEEMMPPSSETDSEFSSESMRLGPSEVDSDEQEQELMFRKPSPEKEETRTAKKRRVNVTIVGGEGVERAKNWEGLSEEQVVNHRCTRTGRVVG
jgi:hypothetical protein